MTILIGSKQLAQKLGISLRTLDTMNKNGELPNCLRIGHLRRWRSEDVDLWIKAKLDANLK
ncbi:helix-turn-helix domain-containing protein [Undibacterium sp.]|uniref:helix-turn-helix transcriptional regulator n=1 Tax=Undibacterium sp. TaxID=1914977 RepID=UPI0025D2A5EB|nr:helix-turn-helix domain-containing protein [Undibacterium sp.]